MDIAERVILTSAGMQAIKMLGQGTPGFNEYFEAVSIFEKATEICRIRKEQTEKIILDQIEKSMEVPKVEIEMGGMKRIRTVRDISWDYGAGEKILPAGWEGMITRDRPGSVTTSEYFEICDCFLKDGSVEEVF